MNRRIFLQVGIIGDGAWGTALANICAENAKCVTIFSRHLEVVNTINDSSINPKAFSHIKLLKNVRASLDIRDLEKMDLILMAIPAQNVRSCLMELNVNLVSSVPVVICAKGIENKSLKLMSQLCEELIPNNPIAVLSGPNFASEIIEKKLSATLIACPQANLGTSIANLISNSYMMGYYTDDIIGVQVAAAAKNVIAIAAGLTEGLKLGENAKAALITRGLKEITQLVVGMGGKLETVFGLAGVGDLLLTCGSQTSRNMKLGYLLASGDDINSILSSGNTYEGYFTTLSIFKLINKLGLELLIFRAMYRILYENTDAIQEIKQLINQPIM